MGNAFNSQASIDTGDGGFLGSSSGSVTNAGNSVGNTLTGGAAIVPGRTVEVGNSQSASAKIATGDGGNGINFLGITGGNSGSINQAGNAAGNTFDGGTAGSGFAAFPANPVVGNAVNSTADVNTGEGGLFASSGSINVAVNSINNQFNAPGNANGIQNVQVGVSGNSSASVDTGDTHLFGGSGGASNVGNAIGSSV